MDLIRAALQRNEDASKRISSAIGSTENASGAKPDKAGSFASTITDAIGDLAATTGKADKLPENLIMGRVGDIHEAAAQLKQSELSLKFALQVRNKFVDAYREVMRMSV